MRCPFVSCLLGVLGAGLLACQLVCAQSLTPAEMAVALPPALPPALLKQFPAERYGDLSPHLTTRSPRATHRTYRLMRAGRWRWPATVRVSVAQADGRILSSFADQLRPLPAGALTSPPPDEASGLRLIEQYLLTQLPPAARFAATIRERVPVWYLADSLTGTERAGWLVTWGHPDTRLGAWEAVLDEATGRPAFPPRDLLCYHHGASVNLHRPPPPAWSRDTTAVASVFRPDPLTTAGQP